jgi:hypothetical protein
MCYEEGVLFNLCLLCSYNILSVTSLEGTFRQSKPTQLELEGERIKCVLLHPNLHNVRDK